MPNVTLKRMSPWHCCSFINSFRHFQCCFLLLLLLVNVSKYSFPNDFVWFISVCCSSTSHCNSPLSLAFSLSPLSLSLHPHLDVASLSLSVYPSCFLPDFTFHSLPLSPTWMDFLAVCGRMGVRLFVCLLRVIPFNFILFENNYEVQNKSTTIAFSGKC